MLFKKLLLSLVVITSCVKAAEERQLRFVFADKDGVHEVQSCFVDKILRDVPADKMDIANKVLAIRAVKMDNGEYALHAHVRGVGGSALGYAIGYWGTKVSLNGVYIVACYFNPMLVGGFAQIQTGIDLAASAAGVLVEGIEDTPL